MKLKYMEEGTYKKIIEKLIFPKKSFMKVDE